MGRAAGSCGRCAVHHSSRRAAGSRCASRGSLGALRPRDARTSLPRSPSCRLPLGDPGGAGGLPFASFGRQLVRPLRRPRPCAVRPPDVQVRLRPVRALVPPVSVLLRGGPPHFFPSRVSRTDARLSRPHLRSVLPTYADQEEVFECVPAPPSSSPSLSYSSFLCVAPLSSSSPPPSPPLSPPLFYFLLRIFVAAGRWVVRWWTRCCPGSTGR